jgi:N-acetylglucosaminyldiphosphoundecaprenol N-acetyl-beta-D-mannosaminyltransferase
VPSPEEVRAALRTRRAELDTAIGTIINPQLFGEGLDVFARPASILPPPVRVCGLPIHALTLSESIDAAESLILSGGPHQHVDLNASKVVQATTDRRLASVIENCSMVNADGQSVVWASQLLGQRLPERVAGIDLMLALWDRAAERGFRVYLLGAEAEVVRRTAEIATQRGVPIAGWRDGYWREDEERAVVGEIRQASADILFVGMPSPRKEYFISEHLQELGVALAFGVGGSFDVVAGLRRRAPRWLQRLGLEWTYRLVQEPRRMFRRYLVGNARYLAIVVRHAARHGRRKGQIAHESEDGSAE